MRCQTSAGTRAWAVSRVDPVTSRIRGAGTGARGAAELERRPRPVREPELVGGDPVPRRRLTRRQQEVDQGGASAGPVRRAGSRSPATPRSGGTTHPRGAGAGRGRRRAGGARSQSSSAASRSASGYVTICPVDARLLRTERSSVRCSPSVRRTPRSGPSRWLSPWSPTPTVVPSPRAWSGCCAWCPPPCWRRSSRRTPTACPASGC